jgi:hypothetical protein
VKPSLTVGLLPHHRLLQLKLGPAIGDCEPKFQQTPKKQPSVKA